MTNYNIEFDEKDENYRMVVIRTTKTYKKHRCGYVSVPINHPFYGKHYQHKIACNVDNLEINPTDIIGTFLAVSTDNGEISIGYLAGVHGGITFSEGGNECPIKTEKYMWWFGFDAMHAYDNNDGGQSLEYMIKECEKLKLFLQKNQ